MLGKQRNLKKIWIFTVTQIILLAVHSDKSRATLWGLFLGFQTEPSICPFTCQDDWQDSNAGLWMFTIKVSLFSDTSCYIQWWREQELHRIQRRETRPNSCLHKVSHLHDQTCTPRWRSLMNTLAQQGPRETGRDQGRSAPGRRETVTAGATRASDDHNSAAIVTSLMGMMSSRWVDYQQVRWPKVEICNATPPRRKGVRMGGREGHTITSTDRNPGRIGGPWHHISKSNNYSGRPPYLAGNYLHIIITVKSLIEKIH